MTDLKDIPRHHVNLIDKFLYHLEKEDFQQVAYAVLDLLDKDVEYDLEDYIDPHKDFLLSHLLLDIRNDRHHRLRAILAVLRSLNVNWPELSIIERASFELLPNQR